MSNGLSLKEYGHSLTSWTQGIPALPASRIQCGSGTGTTWARHSTQPACCSLNSSLSLQAYKCSESIFPKRFTCPDTWETEGTGWFFKEGKGWLVVIMKLKKREVESKLFMDLKVKTSLCFISVTIIQEPTSVPWFSSSNHNLNKQNTPHLWQQIFWGKIRPALQLHLGNTQQILSKREGNLCEWLPTYNFFLSITYFTWQWKDFLLYFVESYIAFGNTVFKVEGNSS